jgi:lysozyme
MEVSQRGIDLIKKFEGFKSTAYQDVIGVWTIGYGTTRIDGRPVRPGMMCSREQAEEWLRNDVNEYLAEAEPYINPDANLTQNQVDAIASFIYNIGVSNFKKSTLLRLINEGDMDGASKEFIRWNKAGGKEFPGLTRRRLAETELFMATDN